jgi:hypothetical protein
LVNNGFDFAGLAPGVLKNVKPIIDRLGLGLDPGWI